MKEISLHPNSIKNRTPISTRSSPLTLSYVRSGIFVISEPFEDRQIFVFESHALLGFREQFPDVKITEVVIIHYCTAKFGQYVSQKELRLLLDSAEWMILNEADELLITSSVKPRMFIQGHEFSACDVFALDDEAPYSQIYISERLAEKLNRMAKNEAQRKHLLHVLWRDYEQALTNLKRPLALGESTAFQAEIDVIKARVCTNHRVAFDFHVKPLHLSATAEL